VKASERKKEEQFKGRRLFIEEKKEGR